MLSMPQTLNSLLQNHGIGPFFKNPEGLDNDCLEHTKLTDEQ